MNVEWRDTSVSVGDKMILAPCSGHIRPGRMVALMGPSGSGKSTFLRCLRQDVAHRGQVQFDGARFTPELRQLIGFVEQDDVVIPQLTVRQSLMFLAELRFGVRSQKAADRVEEVIGALRLSRVVDSKVGNAEASERISGGERKRLCIARELIGDPRLLMCDEPTSGLDSTMADQVVASMRSLCDGRSVSVLASIHQPSTNIFARFDELMLLREGEALYYGPAADAETFFTSHGLPRRPSQSVAEHLMDLLVFAGTDGSKQHAGDGCDSTCGDPSFSFECSSAMSKETLRSVVACVRSQFANLTPLPPANKRRRNSQGEPGRKRYEAPLTRQLAVLSARHRSMLLDEIFTKAILVQNIGLMLVTAALWVQLGVSEADLYSHWSLCVWMTGIWMFFPFFGSLETFSASKDVVERELRVGCYSLEAFYLARTLLLLPLELVWPAVWTTGVFWISNVNPNFGTYLLVVLAICLQYALFQGIGLAISASGRSQSQKTTLGFILISYFFAWCGLFMDFALLPEWIRWVQHGNVYRYVCQLMGRIVITNDVDFTCDGVSVGRDAMNSGVGCEFSGSGSWLLHGARARERLGITSGPWLCLAVIVACLVFFRVLALAMLRSQLRASIDGRTSIDGDGEWSPRTATAPSPADAAAKQDTGFAASV